MGWTRSSGAVVAAVLWAAASQAAEMTPRASAIDTATRFTAAMIVTSHLLVPSAIGAAPTGGMSLAVPVASAAISTWLCLDSMADEFGSDDLRHALVTYQSYQLAKKVALLSTLVAGAGQISVSGFRFVLLHGRDWIRNENGILAAGTQIATWSRYEAREFIEEFNNACEWSPTYCRSSLMSIETSLESAGSWVVASLPTGATIRSAASTYVIDPVSSGWSYTTKTYEHLFFKDPKTPPPYSE